MGLDVMALRGATWIDPQPDPDYADEHYEGLTKRLAKLGVVSGVIADD